jgi:hypothetical protein
MPRCCILPPTSLHGASLLSDASKFSAWGAGVWPLPLFPAIEGLTSALHVDLKLWAAAGGLPHGYVANGDQPNAWMVARPVMTPNPIPVATKAAIWHRVLASFPAASSSCVILTYDVWILKEMRHIRAVARAVPGGHGLPLPTMLATLGMAQMLLNVFVKYQLSWKVAGQYIGAVFVPYHGVPYHGSIDPTAFVCALHSPIDNVLLRRLLDLPLGEQLRHQGCLRRAGPGVQLQQLDGTWVTWSRIECPTTYYGLQWALRRLAMRSWTTGCAAACWRNGTGGIDPTARSILAECFPDAEEIAGEGPDWIDVAGNLPDNVLDQTLEAMNQVIPNETNPSHHRDRNS